MISMVTLKWLLEVWDSFGYDSFKLEIKELGLLKKGYKYRPLRLKKFHINHTIKRERNKEPKF